MKPTPILLALLVGIALMGATCSSDPNVEGAKLDLRNKDYDRALSNIETALQRNPDNAEALDLKGQILQEQLGTIQDVDQHSALLREMVASYRRAIEVDPSLQDATEQRLRLAYYNEFQRGLQAFNQGEADESNYVAANEYFGNAAYIFPDSSDAHANQAYSLLNAGLAGEASTALEKAMAAGDDKPDTYVYLADLYIREAEDEKAIDLLQEGIDKYPENEQMWSLLLNQYVKTGELETAMERYGDLVVQHPDNKLYRFNYGTLLLNADEYEAAIEQLNEAVRLDPNYPNAQYNLAAAYVNMAVDLSERIGEMDDDLRARRAEMSSAEQAEVEGAMEDLGQQREQLFRDSIPPLERALELFREAGGETTDVCQTLFSAYVQTGQNDKAQEVAACAGYEDLE